MEKWQDWLWLQFLFLRHDIIRFLRRIRLIGPDKRPKPIDPPMLRLAPYGSEPRLSRVLGIQMIGQPGMGETLTMNIPEALRQAPIWYFEEAEEPEALDLTNPVPLDEIQQLEDEPDEPEE